MQSDRQANREKDWSLQFSDVRLIVLLLIDKELKSWRDSRTDCFFLIDEMN